ncbi:hypothetical protein D3C74_490770 [compost metagenome]
MGLQLVPVIRRFLFKLKATVVAAAVYTVLPSKQLCALANTLTAIAATRSAFAAACGSPVSTLLPVSMA